MLIVYHRPEVADPATFQINHQFVPVVDLLTGNGHSCESDLPQGHHVRCA